MMPLADDKEENLWLQGPSSSGRLRRPLYLRNTVHFFFILRWM